MSGGGMMAAGGMQQRMAGGNPGMQQRMQMQQQMTQMNPSGMPQQVIGFLPGSLRKKLVKSM